MSERFTKWQERTQNLRTHTISVFLGITIATIGFIVDKVTETSFDFVNGCSKKLFFAAVTLLVIHIMVSLILLLNRLEGFRKTTTIVRNKDKGQISDLEELRAEATEIDENTHWLFRLSVAVFALAELLTMIAFMVQIFSKLK